MFAGSSKNTFQININFGDNQCQKLWKYSESQLFLSLIVDSQNVSQNSDNNVAQK